MASAVGRQETQSARDFLKSLREEIRCHPGVGHSLLGRMLTDPRTRHDFKTLASQHYPLVANFTTYMELLLLRAPNSEAKRWLAKVLVDEYGERSHGDDHAASYRTFMHAAGIAPGSEESYPLHPGDCRLHPRALPHVHRGTLSGRSRRRRAGPRMVDSRHVRARPDRPAQGRFRC